MNYRRRKLSLFFSPCQKVISEEHEKQPVDFASIPDIDKRLAEIDELVTSDQLIQKKDITVWIDPLDATQEYKEEKDAGKTINVCRKNPEIYIYFMAQLKRFMKSNHANYCLFFLTFPFIGKVFIYKRLLRIKLIKTLN